MADGMFVARDRRTGTHNDRLGEGFPTLWSTCPMHVYTHVHTHVYPRVFAHVYTHVPSNTLSSQVGDRGARDAERADPRCDLADAQGNGGNAAVHDQRREPCGC